jgi:hypothetical protein
MITIQTEVLDFMKSTPVNGANVAVTLKVVPRWRDHTSWENPTDFSGQPDTFTGLATSVVPGIFTASLDIGESFQDVARRIPVAGRIEALPTMADVDIRVAVAGLERTVSFPERIAGPNESATFVVNVDFAKAIVGHTTSNSVVLWFSWHGVKRPGDRYFCEITSLQSPASSDQYRIEVDFGRPDPAQTAVVEFDGLLPATQYWYHLRLVEGQDGEPGGRVLASGAFKTAPTIHSESMSFVFGSCHSPEFRSLTDDQCLNRWKELALRHDYDLMLLIGDQIYEDRIEALGKSWFECYANRYQQFWTYWPMREVLRRTPTYMIFDDHEVKDDWGTVPIAEPGREYEALRAYRSFQHSHNPGGRDPDSPFYYNFRWGPAAFFMLDCRSRRAIPRRGQHPILGEQQFKDFKHWAEGEAREADIIFIVSPVPIAYIPVELLKRLIEYVENRDAPKWGGIVGGSLGGLLGGPVGFLVGAGIGAYAGHRIMQEVFKREGLADLTTHDLADMWTLKENQVELAHVLDVLFNLANDVHDGIPGDHRRAVFILSGDVHAGAMHLIASDPNKNPHHLPNPFIYQLISSPITNHPVRDEVLVDIVKHIKPGKPITTIDLAVSRGNLFNSNPACFPLDDQIGKRFSTQFWELVTERNFAHVALARVSKDRRVYQFKLSIEGESKTEVKLLELDLDADLVEPKGTLRLPDILAEGDLVRGEGNPAVYLIESGTRRWVPDEATLLSKWTWEQVHILWSEIIDTIPRGPDLPSVIERFPQVPAAAHVSVVSRSVDKLNIFATAASGAVRNATWEPTLAGGWHGWWPIGDIRVPAGAPVHVVSRSADKLDLFVTDIDGVIRTAAWEPTFTDGWHGWWELNGGRAAPGAPVTAVSRSPDKLDVFVVGTDNRVWTAAWQPSFPDWWHGWWPVGLVQGSGAPRRVQPVGGQPWW